MPAKTSSLGPITSPTKHFINGKLLEKNDGLYVGINKGGRKVYIKRGADPAHNTVLTLLVIASDIARPERPGGQCRYYWFRAVHLQNVVPPLLVPHRPHCVI
ncbi:hypothetical protein J6590_033847 [Homalodisca vitripennis]|nr:hypothetical protein J6590_033847 [Homalodisca vitripennis]